MRFKAPADTTAISLTCGEFAVEADGFVEVPDQLTDGDLLGLVANGFESAPADVKPAAGKSAGKA